MPIVVTPVESKRDLRAFIRFPYWLHRRQKAFVPPLISDVKSTLDRDKNPFFEHAQMEMFLAVWDKQIVGRIAAIIDQNFIDVRREMIGLFGFFECVKDLDVAHSLFNTASNWLRKRHIRKMLGPANPSLNDEIGVLIDSFDHPPCIKMVWNPPYYPALYEQSYFHKARDVYAWIIQTDNISERLVKFGEVTSKRLKINFRNVNLKDFSSEVALFRGIYNQAWADNWGFVPWTEAEFSHAAKDLKKIIDPRLVIIAEDNNKPVGFGLALPDLNIALKRINGKLTPLNLLKLMWYGRKIKFARVVILGVIKEYRNKGIDAALYYQLLQTAKNAGYTGGEASWILEDNVMMNRALEMIGAKRYKTYRLYGRNV